MGTEKKQAAAVFLVATMLAGCSSTPHQGAQIISGPFSGKRPATSTAYNSGQASSYACTYAASTDVRGNFYKDDGPLELPQGLDRIPEPLPRSEPLHRWANNPYTVLGQTFSPLKTPGTLKERGIGSWYGRKFHGQKTSSGEAYDMFGMTAAHPTLPIPSYARVTHLKNGRSIVVRINDRGPFLKGRVIDLSFLAACRLGYAINGSAEVEVVSLQPDAPILASMPLPAESPHQRPDLPPEQKAPTPPVATALQPSSGNTIFLQLGAFSSRANAESFHAHLARELDDAQAHRLAIHENGALYRVRLGPFSDRATALAAAEKLTGQKNIPTVIAR